MTAVSISDSPFSGSMRDTPQGIVATLSRSGASYYSPPMQLGPGQAPTVTVTSASNTTPIVITVGQSLAQLPSGASITITGALGNTAANGTWVPVPSSTPGSLVLPGSAGSGTYVANSATFLLPVPTPPPAVTLPPNVLSSNPPTTTPQATPEAARLALIAALQWGGDLAYSMAGLTAVGTLYARYLAAKSAGQ